MILAGTAGFNQQTSELKVLTHTKTDPEIAEWFPKSLDPQKLVDENQHRQVDV